LAPLALAERRAIDRFSVEIRPRDFSFSLSDLFL
jgi:hypothetical protein